MKKLDPVLEALIAAFEPDTPAEDALIAEMDRRFEAAKAAGTLPNTDAPFERFWRRWTSTGETVAVMFRRYLMATGLTATAVAQRAHLSPTVTDALLDLKERFDAGYLDDLVLDLAQQTGERAASIRMLLKEVAAHHYARTTKSPALLAARPRRTT